MGKYYSSAHSFLCPVPILSLTICLFILQGNASGQIQSTSSNPDNIEKLITVLNTADRIQVQYFLPSPETGCVVSLGDKEGSRSCVKGFLTVVFSKPLFNPIVHLALASSFVAGNSWAAANSYRLLTPGTAMTLLRKSIYLAVATVMGQPQLAATALKSSDGMLQPACVMTINFDQFCEDVQISGNHSMLTFEVSRIAVPVLMGADTTQITPASP